MTQMYLYPNGYAFASVALTAFLDDNHPAVMTLQQAVDNYFKYCTTDAVVTVIVKDYPIVGTDTTITNTLSGFRLDKTGTAIVPTTPLLIDGATTDYHAGNDFASPYDYANSLVTGQGFGPDNTYGGRFRFDGLMPFNATNAVPAVIGGFTVTCSNGSVFSFSFQEPGTSLKVQGAFFTLNTQSIPIWFSWSGAAIPLTKNPTGTVSVTSTSNFIWP